MPRSRAILIASALAVALLAAPSPSGEVRAQDWEVTPDKREQKILQRLFNILEGDPFNEYAFKQVLRRADAAGGIDAVTARYAERLAGDPDNVAYLLILARLNGQRGELPTALGYLDAAAEVGEPDWRVFRLRGELRADSGDGEGARVDLQAALEVASRRDDRIEILRSLSGIARREEKHEEAADYLRQIAELAPRDRYLRWELGQIFYEQEDWEGALEQYQKASELAGRNVQERARALVEVAGLYEKLARFDEAIETYDTILGLTRESNWMHKETRIRLVDVYRSSGRLEALLERLDTRLKRRRRDAWALALKARLLVELDRGEEAVPVFEAYIKAHKKDLEIFDDYIQLLRERGDHESVVAAYRLAMERADEREIDVLLDLVRYLQRSSQVPLEAYTVLVEFEERFSEPRDLQRILEAYLDLGSSEDITRRATALLDRVIAADPERVESHLLKLSFLLGQGDAATSCAWDTEPSPLERALDTLIELEGFTANDAEKVVELLEAQRQRDAALAFIERATARRPDDLELLYLRAQRLDPQLALAETLRAWRTLLLAAESEAHIRDASARYIELLERYGLTAAVLERETRELALAPDDWRRGRLVFFLRVATGRLDEAFFMLEGLEAAATPGVALEEDAVHLLEQRFPEQAITLLLRLAAKKPRLDWRYKLRAADLYVDTQNPEAAAALIEEALENGGTLADAQNMAGQVFVRIKRFEEAQRAFERAVELSPTVSAYRHALAKVLSRRASALRDTDAGRALSSRAYSEALEALRLLQDEDQVDELYQIVHYEAGSLGYDDAHLRRDLRRVVAGVTRREVSARLETLIGSP